MNEFFYGESLRWNFGFDNPNKAAVIFACLIPLCWWAWSAAWEIRRAWVRIPSLVFSACAFLAAGVCLIMTFSRGGLVAGVVALGYLLARKFHSEAAHLANHLAARAVGFPHQITVDMPRSVCCHEV